MAIYAIGDVQGCHDELMALLDAIAFTPGTDRLWLVGDLVNRGPRSLEVLRTVMALGDDALTVLGNHDLHLLARAFVPGVGARRRDTLEAVLDAPDRAALLAWLRTRPLFHHDPAAGFAMVHAGLPPQWSVADAAAHAAEVAAELAEETRAVAFLGAMYGDEPRRWDPALSGAARLRFIVNCLTRLRYCDAAGNVDLAYKGQPEHAPAGLLPWYALPGRASRDVPLLFGHWSTLHLDPAASRRYRVWHLDTGAVWGGELTALRLEDRRSFSVPSRCAVPID